MSLSPYDNLEQRRMAQLRAGEIRAIHRQSARKHRRQGHRVQWCGYLGSYIWFPNEATKDQP